MFKRWDIKYFKHPAEGYVEDLQYFISENYPENPDQVILTITADMPLITGKIIDDVLFEYERCGNPAMCVAVPVHII